MEQEYEHECGSHRLQRGREGRGSLLEEPVRCLTAGFRWKARVDIFVPVKERRLTKARTVEGSLHGRYKLELQELAQHKVVLIDHILSSIVLFHGIELCFGKVAPPV